MEENTFIATCVQSLEDLLKTSLCTGKNIYCQFDESKVDEGLKMFIKHRNVTLIFARKEVMNYAISSPESEPDLGFVVKLKKSLGLKASHK